MRADLALRAVIAQEEIEATDDELDAEIERVAERFDEKPAQVRKDLERRGVLEAVRSDIARGEGSAVPRGPRRSGRRRTATPSTSPCPSPSDNADDAPDSHRSAEGEAAAEESEEEPES